jgi:uncharacterized membrane protein YedE/YeeE
LRGVFANFRIVVLEGLSVAMPDDIRSDLASLSARILGFDIRAPIAAIVGGGLCLLAFSHPKLRRSPRLLSAGVALGVLTVAGWIATSWIGDEFAGPMRPQSLTFVSTVGKAFYAALLSAPGFADFGVGSVFGVTAGSFLAAWRSDELQWEAFDDDREMRRHLGGAALMGIGGILAGGCTIGQGITAGSMLSLSWPFAVGGMMIGARMGIATLIDTTPRQLLSRSWASLLGRTHPSK